MKQHNLRLAFTMIGFASTAVSCGNQEPLEVQVGAQETNVRPDSPLPECDAFEYTMVTTRSCDEVGVAATVCANQPLCQSQLDTIEAGLISCDLAGLGVYDWSPTECE